jgi:hypothetical protein
MAVQISQKSRGISNRHDYNQKFNTIAGKRVKHGFYSKKASDQKYPGPHKVQSRKKLHPAA